MELGAADSVNAPCSIKTTVHGSSWGSATPGIVRRLRPNGNRLGRHSKSTFPNEFQLQGQFRYHASPVRVALPEQIG